MKNLAVLPPLPVRGGGRAGRRTRRAGGEGLRPRLQLLEFLVETLDHDLGVGHQAGVRGEPQPHVPRVADDADAEPQAA